MEHKSSTWWKKRTNMTENASRNGWAVVWGRVSLDRSGLLPDQQEASCRFQDQGMSQWEPHSSQMRISSYTERAHGKKIPGPRRHGPDMTVAKMSPPSWFTEINPTAFPAQRAAEPKNYIMLSVATCWHQCSVLCIFVWLPIDVLRSCLPLDMNNPFKQLSRTEAERPPQLWLPWLVGRASSGPQVCAQGCVFIFVGLDLSVIWEQGHKHGQSQWFRLLLHSKKVLGSSPLGPWSFSLWSLCFCPLPMWILSVLDWKPVTRESTSERAVSGETWQRGMNTTGTNLAVD